MVIAQVIQNGYGIRKKIKGLDDSYLQHSHPPIHRLLEAMPREESKKTRTNLCQGSFARRKNIS
jgi:hypothetical protein